MPEKDRKYTSEDVNEAILLATQLQSHVQSLDTHLMLLETDVVKDTMRDALPIVIGAYRNRVSEFESKITENEVYKNNDIIRNNLDYIKDRMLKIEGYLPASS